jgi:predicted Zn-dependent protease
MMSTRAKVLSNTGVDALRTWQAQADDPALQSLPVAQQAGIWYGAALAASSLREVALARQDLARLQALAAPEPSAAAPVRWLAAEIDLAARDLSPAQLTSLAARLGITGAQGVPVTDLRRPELMLQAQVALQLNQASMLNTVGQSLQSWLVNQPHDALAWQTLGSLYTAQNQALRALRAQAEAQAARLDVVGAIDRLRAAQDLMRANEAAGSTADHIDASIIDTRQRELEALLKQQALNR